MKKHPVRSLKPDSEKARLPTRGDAAGLETPEEKRADPKHHHPEVLEGEGVTRRSVMQLMAASALLALGTPGCKRKPYRKIVSMADTPEYQHPGKSLYYASCWTEGRTPYGIMIKTLDGRPVKIEGLPNHPLNRGASSARMQASILSLYDPDRLKTPMRGQSAVTWQEADQAIVDALKKAKKAVLLTRASLGPSERLMVEDFLETYPAARHFIYESVHDGPRRWVWEQVYEAEGEVFPLFSQAKVILSLDSDFLGTESGSLEVIQALSQKRTEDQSPEEALRLYAAESAMTLTGSNADHRIPIKPSAILDLVQALRAAVNGDEAALEQTAHDHNIDIKVLQALAGDLKTHPGESLILAGPHLPEAVHAAVCLLNHELGASGKTMVWNYSPANRTADDPAVIASTLEEGVDLLIMLGVNPVYDWPGGGFESLLAKATLSVGHSLYADETASACTLALPSSHNLESWNDAVSTPGVHSLCQPVIAPLFDSRQEAESLLVWQRALNPDSADPNPIKDWHDYLKRGWRLSVLAKTENRELAWEETLRAGFVGQKVSWPMPALNKEMVSALAAKAPPASNGLELVIVPHHALFDGRFANNAWLQEFPDPISKLVWENAAVIGPATADQLNLEEGDRVEIKTGDRTITLPVLIQPGVAAQVVVASLGYGRTKAGRVGSDKGVNVAALLQTGPEAWTPWLAFDVQLSKTGTSQTLVRTQKAFSMEKRPIVIHGTAQEYADDPAFVKKHLHKPEDTQLHESFDYSMNPKWAMAVDLNACVGCGICMIACQAENNIPIVGREECAKGREMHWMRIDRYEEGDPENPHVYHQPMLCQHCDNAPCESVCPVNATAHSPEGLNEQVYNRCVGTRYCANNCPYKVRRFNFFNYTKEQLKDPVQELAYNPHVTVRSRGVMEKCTFCVQRINEEKFKARNKGEAIPDGAIRPACQQACPAGAIVFGDLNDPKSRISKMKDSPLAYFVLEELNVRPNVSYLARVRNPHPDLIGHEEDPIGHDDGGHG